MTEHLYGLIYRNENGDYMHSIVKADSYFDAERKGKKDVEKWDGFQLFKVNYLTALEVLDSGAVVFVGG